VTLQRNARNATLKRKEQQTLSSNVREKRLRFTLAGRLMDAFRSCCLLHLTSIDRKKEDPKCGS